MADALMRSQHLRLWLSKPTAIAASMFVFGVFLVPLSAILAKQLLASYTPTELTAIRFMSGLAVCLFLIHRARWADAPSVRSLGVFFSLGVSSIVGFLLFVIAIGEMSVSRATGLFFCYPFTMVVFGSFFLGERIDTLRWGQTALGFFGVWLMLSAREGEVSWYDLAAILSGVAVAARMVITRHAAKKYAPLRVMVYESFFAAVIMLVFVDPSALFSGKGGFILAFYLLTSNLSRIFLIFALRDAQASLLAPLAFLELMFAVLMEGMILSSWLNISQLASLLVICIAGVWSCIRTRNS